MKAVSLSDNSVSKLLWYMAVGKEKWKESVLIFITSFFFYVSLFLNKNDLGRKRRYYVLF